MINLQSIRTIATLLVVIILSTAKLRAQDIVAYNNLINHAEIELTNNDHFASAKFYEKAFSLSGEKAFGKDLLNAFHCAMECRRPKVAEMYLRMLLKKGITSSAFDYLILKWYPSPQEKKMIQSWYLKYDNDTLKKDAIANTIKSWLDSDQFDRHTANEHSDDPLIQSLMNSRDSMRAASLYSTFVQLGVPTVDAIGFLDDNSLVHPLYWILVLHNSQGYNGYTESHLFDSLMYRAVFEWKINASELFELLNNSDMGLKKPPCENFGALSVCYPLTSDVLQLGMDPNNAAYEIEVFGKETESRINMMRAHFGVETLAETRAKFNYAKTRWGNPFEGKFKLLTYTGNSLVYLDKLAFDKKLSASLTN